MTLRAKGERDDQSSFIDPAVMPFPALLQTA
jgi:hypothetical protein